MTAAVTTNEETWTVARALRWMHARFNDLGIDSARLDAELLLAETLGCNRLGVVTRAEQPLDEPERQRLRDLVRRRQNHEPVAYILGHKGFRDFDVAVGPGVLIPRPETEFVVDAALELLHDGRVPEGPVVDFGTGSGILAIALQHAQPDRAVIAIEADTDAAAYAQRNFAALAATVELRREDWQTGTPDDVALAVANPPYVGENERADLAADLEHEPQNALFAGADGLDAVRQLAPLLARHLQPGGWWVCEVGAGQRSAITTLLDNATWSDPTWTRDYAGTDRVFAVQKQAAA